MNHKAESRACPDCTGLSNSTPFRLLLLLPLLFFVACTELPAAPRQVTIYADGQRYTVETKSELVKDVLEEAQLSLEGLDRINMPETAELTNGMVLTITRVLQYTETETETVAFGRQVVRDANIPEGESRLLEAGKPGTLERVYRLTEENGVVIERVLVREAVADPPRDEVHLIGTRPQIQTTPITGTLIYLNNQDAWLIRESNRGRRQLTTLGDLDGRVFSLSPDRGRLIFTRSVTESNHLNELWLVSTTEADPTPVPLNLEDVLWADWSPDGERLAWTTAEVMERAPGWRGQNDLWIARLTSRHVLLSKQQLLQPEAGGGYGWWGTRYAWDPEGKRLAYTRPDEVGVVSANTVGRNTRLRLAQFAAYRTYSSWAWSPAIDWSPDGNFIATVLHGTSLDITPEESPIFNLWVLEATGAYSAELASEVGMWATPKFSPNGTPFSNGALLFGRATIPYQSETSPHKLCFIDRDGSNQTCPYPTDEESQIEIPAWQWGPDRAYLAFLQQGEIYILHIADNTATRITDEGNIRQFQWR